MSKKTHAEFATPTKAPEVVEETGLAPLEDTTEDDLAWLGGGSGAEAKVNLAIILNFNEKTKAPRNDCLAAGVKEGDFYLKDSLGIRAFNPIRLVIIGEQAHFFIRKDNAGKTVDAKEWLQGAKKPEGAGWKEHTVGLVAAISDDGKAIQPAILQTDDALGRLWDNIRDAQRATGEDNIAAWASRGPQYKASAGAKFPPSRFFATISSTAELTKDKSSTYILGKSKSAPTTEELVALLDATFSTPGYIRALKNAFDARVRGVLAKAK